MARIAWKPIFLEALFVVLGVVLALGLNEWRQHIAAEAHAREALASIHAEIAANRAVVSESQNYHMGLMRTLGRLRTTGGPSPNIRETFNRGFVHPARVVDTAWETAQRTGAFSTIDYRTLLSLGSAYANQESYETQAQQIGPLLYTAMYTEGTQSIADNYANLVDVVGTFWYRERELVAQYDSTLAHLDRLDALAAPPAADAAASESPVSAPDTTAAP